MAIGFFHLLLGNAAIPGIADAGPTVDSFGRFMGAVFAGYGAAWIQAARQAPVPARAVRWLAAVLLLGGLARVLSIAADGRPHWFQLVLMAVEFGLPPVYWWLADADERARGGGRPGGGRPAEGQAVGAGPAGAGPTRA
nr:hypothetical protein KitaXyl93_12220 [Kitasatospora sp. Xyl93]